MVSSVRSATEATIDHLEIAKKEETMTGQVKRQGNAQTVFELIWKCSRGIHPRRSDCKQARYKEILCCLCNSIRCKRPELWRRKNCLLLHDNTPAHRTVLVQEELTKQEVTVFTHPPYSSDLTPCDFFFLPHLKEELRGRPFQLAEDIVNATRKAVRDLPINIFQHCFQQLYQRWQTCIAANGDYFEGGCGYV
jgi:transposase